MIILKVEPSRVPRGTESGGLGTAAPWRGVGCPHLFPFSRGGEGQKTTFKALCQNGPTASLFLHGL